jgi:hypothetical protein
MAQQVLQIGLDFVVALPELRQHRERLQRVLGGQRQLGHPPQDHVGHLEIEILDGFLGNPDVLGKVEAALLADVAIGVCFHGLPGGMPPGRGQFHITVAPFQGLASSRARGRQSQFPTSSLGKYVRIPKLY